MIEKLNGIDEIFMKDLLTIFHSLSQEKIGKLLRKEGWEVRQLTINGKRIRKYFRHKDKMALRNRLICLPVRPVTTVI